MDILYERWRAWTCTRTRWFACVRILAEGKTKRECRTFSTRRISLRN